MVRTMVRISLKEQYDNKDVVQQIYTLKDNQEQLVTATEEAVQASKDAVATVGQYTQRIDRAETTATEAKTIAQSASDQVSTAEQTAQQAMTTVLKAFVAQTFEGTAETVSLKQTKGSGATDSTAIPIADGTRAGIMNAQTFNGITSLSNRVTALEGQARTYYVGFPTQDPTQGEITSVVQAVKGSSPTTGDYAEDIARNLRYGYNGSEWLLVRGTTSSVFTSTAAGLIKGAVRDGCVFAEADGTGSVYGWDVVKNHTSTYGSKVDTLESQMTTVNADISNIKASVKGAQSTADTANATASQASSKADDNTSKITTLQGNVEKNISDISALSKDKQDRIVGRSVQLTAGGWNTSSKQQVVNVEGVTLASLLWIGPDGGSWSAYGDAGVRAIAQGAGTVTFECDEIPTAILTVNVIIG